MHIMQQNQCVGGPFFVFGLASECVLVMCAVDIIPYLCMLPPCIRPAHTVWLDAPAASSRVPINTTLFRQLNAFAASTTIFGWCQVFFCGTMEKASELLTSGAAGASDFSLLAGASAWKVSKTLLLNPFVEGRDGVAGAFTVFDSQE